MKLSFGSLAFVAPVATMLAACTPAEAPSEPATLPVTEMSITPPPPEPSIVGGYGAADPEDEAVKAAQTVAVDEVYTREPTRALVEKVEVQQQVVAGMNYRFEITMSGGARYSVTVYRDLQGAMTVTDFAKLN